MSMHESSLPEAWVERIFATMRATYGAAFDRQWECPPGVDPADHGQQLKAHWGRELARYQQSPDAIRYGLENLPPHPPNLVEFRSSCNRRPDQAQLSLPPVKADPARVAQALSRMRAGIKAENPKAWAWRLRDRENAGERLTIAQRDMWRAALKSEIDRAEEA